MNAITGLGKYLLAIPVAVFGFFHFVNASAMAGMVPIPGGAVWVYITGVALVAAAVSIVIGKLDKLAAMLLGVLLLIFALSIHLPLAIDGDQGGMANLLKDTAMAGGAWMYAGKLAKDKAIIG